MASPALPRIFNRKPLDQIVGFSGESLGDQLKQSPNLFQREPEAIDPQEQQKPIAPDPSGAENIQTQFNVTPEQLAEIGAPLMVRKGKYGHPQREGMIGDGSPEEKSIAYNQAVQQYQPQKAKGWWDRFVKPALIGSGIGFLAGGPGGAIGGAAANTLRSTFNAKAPNEDWKRRQLRETNPEVANIYQRRKLEDEDAQRQAVYNKAVADTDLAKARKKELGQRSPNVQIGTAVLPDGRTVQMERDGSAWKMSVGADGQPVVRKAAPSNKEKVLVDVPGIGKLEVTPEAALGYYGATSNREQTREDKASEVQFSNSQLQSNISEAQGEIGKIESRMKDIPMTITETDPVSERVTTRSNPEYTEHKNRRDQLLDKIREWKGSMKAVPQSKPSSPNNPNGQKKYRVNPKFLQ